MPVLGRPGQHRLHGLVYPSCGRPLEAVLGAAADPLPLSMCEALCTALGLWLIFMAVRTVQNSWRGGACWGGG